MGLWADTFHPRKALDFTVFAFLFATFLSVGLSVNNLWVKGSAFVLTALVLIAKIAYTAIASPDPPLNRILFGCGLSFVVLGIVTLIILAIIVSATKRSTERAPDEKKAAEPRPALTQTVVNTPTATVTPTDTTQRVTEPPVQDTLAIGSRQNPLTIAPSVLMKMYQDNNGIQANRLMAPYRGKWIRTSGVIQGIHGDEDSAILNLDSPSGGDMQLLLFEKQLDQLALLSNGEKVEAVCTIRGASHYAVEFENCELLPPQAKTNS